MSDISELRVVDGWYRGPDKDWEFEAYGFNPNGLSDLIYNNLRKIIEDDDKSRWAYDVFYRCLILLINGKRWPDEYNPPKIEGKIPYRSQYSMTRDPWIMFYAACIHLEQREWFYLKPMLWWLYRPELWALRRALLGKPNMFKLIRSVNNLFGTTHEYVRILRKYMDWSYDRKDVE